MAWIQVEAFKKELNDFCTRNGKTQAQAALDLGTTYGNLRFWLTGKRSPRRDSLINAAKVFGCSVTRFMDDPGQKPTGKSLAHLSEQKRALASMLLDTFSSADLTDEDAKMLYDDFIVNLNKLQSLKSRFGRNA